jgi:hypothetical protein
MSSFRAFFVSLSVFALVALGGCSEPEAADVSVDTAAKASTPSATEEKAQAAETPSNPLADPDAVAEGEEGKGDESIPEGQRDDGSDKAADPNKAPPSGDFKDMRVSGGKGPKAPDGRQWKSVGEAKLGSALVVQGTAESGAGSEDLEKSGLRVYFGPLEDAPLEGYVLYLGKGDTVVVKGQTAKQGVYDKELYRSSTAAKRGTGGAVTLRVPASALPKKDLKVWGGTGGELNVAGVVLPAPGGGASADAADANVEKPEYGKASESSAATPAEILFVTVKL